MAEGRVEEAQVTVAFRGGSQDLHVDRVVGFTRAARTVAATVAAGSRNYIN